MDSDLAILRPVTNIVYNSNVQQTRIAGSNYNILDNQVVWAAGWGTISVSIVQKFISLFNSLFVL